MARSKLLKYGVPLLMGAGRVALSGVGDAIRGQAKGVASSVFNRIRSRFGSRRTGGLRRKVRTSRAVTQQHDVRSMSFGRGRSGRKWRKFRAKVRAAIQADNPRHLYQAVYKSSGSATDSVAGFDGVYFLDLNTTNQGDVWNVFKDAYGSTSSDMDNYKLYMKSAQCDFMLKNLHATNPCEVDVYECIARRDDTQTGTPGQLFSTYFADMDATGTVSAVHPGLSPFQVPNFIRSWKVIKTTKYMIDPGKSISMQSRASLNRVVSGLKLSQSFTIEKYTTRMIFFRVRGVPENATATGTNPASGLGAWSVAWSAITDVSYQSMPTADESEDVDQSK